MTLREILDAVQHGTLSPAEAERYLDGYGFVEIGFHRLDVQRERRTGIPEVVFGRGKTIEQLNEILAYYHGRKLPLLVTKVSDDHAARLKVDFPSIDHVAAANILRLGSATRATEGEVAVVSAGSSDFAIAEEAAATLEFFGVGARRLYDCGVAGLHRLFAAANAISSADVIIAVAGMEGALPSVMAGIFSRPIIAVPTSVGYGASFDGLAALLTMMNACAPGITVVNIDNGFGAAIAARAMLQVSERRRGVDQRSS